jgi:hypothetical protein
VPNDSKSAAFPGNLWFQFGRRQPRLDPLQADASSGLIAQACTRVAAPSVRVGCVRAVSCPACPLGTADRPSGAEARSVSRAERLGARWHGCCVRLHFSRPATDHTGPPSDWLGAIPCPRSIQLARPRDGHPDRSPPRCRAGRERFAASRPPSPLPSGGSRQRERALADQRRTAPDSSRHGHSLCRRASRFRGCGCR